MRVSDDDVTDERRHARLLVEALRNRLWSA
jgi:hypothetical protein